jgi:ABC-type uncharacterized transport system permease subunit
MTWINRRLRLGWMLLVAGLIVAVIGILLPVLAGDLPFNARIITGLGIVLLGIGVARLVHYGAVRRDARAARRLIAEERDERTQILNARAGNRAYWISAALAYGGLMWVSLSDNGSLPPLSADALWYFLAALVVVPFIVYIASLLYDQQRG